MTPAQYLLEIAKPHLESLGYTGFWNHLPNSPDLAVVFVDVPLGRLEQRSFRSGGVDEHPSVQVRVRGTSAEAVEVLYTLWDVFAGVYMLGVSDGKIMQCITKANTIGSLGQEPQNRRCTFSQQFRLTILPGD